MRKTLIEGVLDTIIMTVLGFATLWLFRVDGELLVMAMAFGTYGIIGALVFDDWLYKRLKFPKLLNWQDRTGAVMAFVADEAALVAVYSETMPLFRMCSAVSVSFGAGAFVWFWKVYTPSVMKLEQRDLYDRKNYEGSVRRAKTKGKLAKLFSRFLRYQCVNGSYQAGSDYTRPFDTDGYRTMAELMPGWLTMYRLAKATGKGVAELRADADEMKDLHVSDTRLSAKLEDLVTAVMVYKYELALAEKLIEERKAGK